MLLPSHFQQKIAPRSPIPRQLNDDLNVFFREQRLEARLGNIAQCFEVRAMATDLWMVDDLDAFIVSGSVVNKRAKKLAPVVQERNALLAAYQQRRRNFDRLRLQPRPDEEETLEDVFLRTSPQFGSQREQQTSANVVKFCRQRRGV